MAPLISVVTPAYKAVDFISQTIDSVRMQTHRPLEHIVVDDCSPDGLGELVEATIAKSPAHDGYQLRLVRLEKNQGTAAAIQAGLAASQGDFLSWLSADDLFVQTDKSAEQLAILSSQSDASVVFDWRTMEGPVPENSTEVRTFWPWPARLSNSLRQMDPASVLVGQFWSNPINATSALIRRSSMERIGGMDIGGSFAQDGDLWLRMSAAGCQMVGRDHAATFYRQHAGQFSRQSNEHRHAKTLVRVRMLLLLADVGYLGNLLEAEADTLALFAANPRFAREDPIFAAALMKVAPEGLGRRTAAALSLLRPWTRRVDRGQVQRVMTEAQGLLETAPAIQLRGILTDEGLPRKHQKRN